MREFVGKHRGKLLTLVLVLTLLFIMLPEDYGNPSPVAPGSYGGGFSDIPGYFRDLYDVDDLRSTELTISAGGNITATQFRHTVDTAANGATDDLETILGGSTVHTVILLPDLGNQTVVVKHNVGNIWLFGGADITLDDAEDGIMLSYDETNSKWFDHGGGGGGYTDLTEFVDQTAWRVFYSDAAGDVTEIAFGANNTYFKSGGASAIPSWVTPSGSGDVTGVGDCADGDCLDGTSDGGTYIRMYDGSNDYLELNPDALTGNHTIAFRDAAGTALISGDTLTGDATATFDTDGSTAVTVVDDFHNHTSLTISGISVGNTSLAVGSPLTLTTDLLEIGNATTAALGAVQPHSDNFALTAGVLTIKTGGVNGTEILDDTIDSADYAADSIDNEHINWADFTYLGDDGAGGNETYAAGWNADVGPPEKDDIYDYLHLIDTDDDGDVDNLDATALAAAETDPNVNTHAEIIAIIDNTATDVGTGVWTFAGVTLAANENITLGGQTLDHDGTDFVFNDTIAVSADSISDDELDEGATFEWTANHDFGDGNITSLGRLEFYDAALYIDGSTDGQLDIEGDAINILGPTDFAANAVDFDSCTVTLSTVSGAIDAGGATSLEIPNGNNPTTDAAGEIAVDTNNDALEVFAGNGTSRLITTMQVVRVTVAQPETIQDDTDAIPLLWVGNLTAPFGIKIATVGITTAAATSYTVGFEEWVSSATGSGSTIETVATSTSYEAFVNGVELDDSDIAAGSWVYADLPATDIDLVTFIVEYWVKPGN